MNQQFAFHEGHSSTHQLLRLTNYIKSNINDKRSCGLLTFDIEKAFDSVWHNGFLHKMLILNYPLYIVKLVQSYIYYQSVFLCVYKKFQLKLLSSPGWSSPRQCNQPISVPDIHLWHKIPPHVGNISICRRYSCMLSCLTAQNNYKCIKCIKPKLVNLFSNVENTIKFAKNPGYILYPQKMCKTSSHWYSQNSIRTHTLVKQCQIFGCYTW
jgi:Reverse transcriptase (RNA-dependent DNA polymerase)